MDNKTLKSMPLTAFNDEGWMKPPLWIYLNLIFMAKGLIIFICSLASMNTRDEILAIIYPDKTDLYIALALSVIPIITLILFSINELQDNLAIKKVFLVLCIVELTAEVIFSCSIFITELEFTWSTAALFIVQLTLLVFAVKSKKVIGFFKQMLDNQPVLKKT